MAGINDYEWIVYCIIVYLSAKLDEVLDNISSMSFSGLKLLGDVLTYDLMLYRLALILL